MLDQVKQKEQEIANLGNRTKSTKPLISRPTPATPTSWSGASLTLSIVLFVAAARVR